MEAYVNSTPRTSRRTPRARGLLAALLLSGVAAAFSSALAQDTLRIAMPSEPPSLDVHVTSSATGFLHGMINATLVARDPYTGDFVPWLAESWEVLDGGTSIRFDLRDDVYFHDGTNMTAEDVKVTFERMMDPEMAAPAASNAGSLSGVTVVDDYTAIVHYDEPFAPAMLNMTNAYFGILSSAAIESMGDGFSQAPVGAGPFKIGRVVPGDRVELERYDDYAWAPPFYENQGAALVDGITVMFIPDDATQLLLIQTDGLDLAGAPPRDVLRMTESGDVGEGADLQSYAYLFAGVHYLGLTTCCERVTDEQAVRVAIAHAIDREEIVDAALEGLAIPITGLYSPATWGYDPEMTGYAFDLEASAAVLEEAGFTRGSNGNFQRDGQDLSFTVWTYNTPESVRVAQIVQAQLADAGIDMQIQQMESAALLGSTQLGEHDALLINYGWTDGGILTYFFHTNRLETTNRVHFSDPEVDRLLEKGESTVDVDERFAVYQELQTRLLELSPWIPLYTPEITYLARSDVQGLIVNHYSGGFNFHDVYFGDQD